MECPDKSAFVEERIDRILTQYRESPNLLSIIRQDLEQIADAVIETCEIPSKFDILDAVGDQLTIIGRQLGWPRCHCICVPVPVFGFSCGVTTPNQPIVGLCEGGVWSNCQEAGTGDICLDDDEVYRRFLLARRYQVRQLWDIDSLSAAAQHLWGDLATVTSLGGARVAVSPGRTLTTLEQLMLPVAFRVLPLAPGITPYISLQTGKVFGFGAGWGGLCDGSSWLCPEPINPYLCN
ncbi:DUF2612 domain-containing protein [Agrobacterium tumefaciens]|uniref:DUF2612 domain-containing protein n=1 Tax=Agrobacterium tumefaciens TaxID=358 RepID=A0AAP9E326_AGRTU|nr:DUF2612 domain-containing protein [Agrobacterium tumefaciens]NSZ57759.1 DUF2612 domain-containing protein [Agrobacterium tumefaciens]QDY93878.1 DUF2612 domain-containing protein [Agrobacterium tumefaciens]UXS48950.1 DUF2612 domain-containing protein [Agrobacterium tumefaciens]UXS70254.1 DUF2612 domain-containing protein [Agrobacterium tumefaciens]UXS77917.1 DUF2612 domain-containing protein [Agrobacterium tumefaciens]